MKQRYPLIISPLIGPFSNFVMYFGIAEGGWWVACGLPLYKVIKDSHGFLEYLKCC